MDVLHVLSTVLWVAGNLLIAYTCLALIIFVISYFILFDPQATTAGRIIFQFMVSLLGVILLVYIGIFINPSNQTSWLELHPNVEWWRPTFRFVIYAFVAYSTTSLMTLLVLRKWYPHRLSKASDLHLINPRTGTINIIRTDYKNDFDSEK